MLSRQNKRTSSTLISSLGYAISEKFSLKTHTEKSSKTFLLMAGKQEAHTHIMEDNIL